MYPKFALRAHRGKSALCVCSSRPTEKQREKQRHQSWARWGPRSLPRGRFRTARAQRAHSANYYGDYPGNNPENHAPAESCTINSKLKNSNI